MYRILIAEDEEIIRRGVCNSLNWSEIGCEISGAVDNGADAIRFIKNETPDLLLCDIRMPEQSGLEVARFIYENRIDCKIILLTGYNEFTYAQQAITSGVFDYLLKPVEPETLLLAIKRAIRALEDARQMQASARIFQTAADRKDDPLRILTKLVLAGASEADFSDSHLKACGLAVPRCSVAVVSICGSPSAPDGTEAGTGQLQEDLLERIFQRAAALSEFHYILPAQGDLLPLCVGYSANAFSAFCCWETLQIEYFQQTHTPLALASGDLAGSVRQLHTAYERAAATLAAMQPTAPASANPIVKSVLNYLWAHYAHPVKLSDVAEHVFLNPSYISRIMRKETGVGFVEHLLYIRVQKAKQLLLTTTFRTYEIAELTGFGSVKYFSQVFRQYTHMSPSQYRALSGMQNPYA